jgi:hypothetical protein
MASSATAASPRRSSVAPGAPVTGNSRVASTAPAWNDAHDPSTSGTAEVTEVALAVMGAACSRMPLPSPAGDQFVQRMFLRDTDKEN